MEVLYLRDLDQIFQILGYVKLQTETNCMLLITTPLKKKNNYITSLHCLSSDYQLLNIYENQAGFIEELKFGLSNLILVSEVWI